MAVQAAVLRRVGGGPEVTEGMLCDVMLKEGCGIFLPHFM
jgi:hypothetical protein